MAPITADTVATNQDTELRGFRREEQKSAYVQRDKRELPIWQFINSTAPEADIRGVIWPPDSTITMGASLSARADQAATLADRANAELDYYRTLPKGWDGYRAERLNPDLIEFCRAVVSMIRLYCINTGAVPSEITPGPSGDGSIDIEIAHKSKCLILTFHPDFAAINIYTEDGGNPKEEPIEFAALDLEARLAWLFS